MPLSTPYICGAPVGASGTDTLVIPITADVNRTDPSLGATFVFVFVEVDNNSGAIVTDVSDDATPEDAYSLCVFEDGLNHYDPNTDPQAGLIVNALANGVNNITLTLDTPANFVQAVAIAVTGIGPTGGWPSNPLDPSLSWWPTTILAQAEAPVGAPVSVSTGPQWTYDVANNVVMSSPSGTGGVDSNWDWASGEIAIYHVKKATASSDPGGWTWADGSLIDLVQWSVATGQPGAAAWMWEAIAYGSVSIGSAGPSMAGALDDASSLFGGGGNGFALSGGAGPVCGTPPPPGSGSPILRGHIRLSE